MILKSIDQNRADLPMIRGWGRPCWMEGENGQLYVVKKNDFVTGYSVVAREKIASDLAQILDLPVPKVDLYKEQRENGDIKYFSASPRAFPDSQDRPSDAVLLADANLLKMIVFDEWVGNDDRSKSSIVFGTPGPGQPVKLAYVDFNLCFFESTKTGALLDNWSSFPTPEFREAVKEKFSHSAQVPAFIELIEGVTTSMVENIVNTLPDALFKKSEHKAETVAHLERRRENLRGFMRKIMTSSPERSFNSNTLR